MLYKLGIILTFSMLLFSSPLFSQSKQFGTFDIGLNLGFYLPNSYNAKFYNGSESNVNKMSFILNNKYQNNDIKNVLNCTDTFVLAELPSNMRYNITPIMGIYFRKTFDNYFGFGVQFNYSNLTANDAFTIEVDPNNTIATEPDIRIYSIWGKEKRYNIDISVSKYFPRPHSNHYLYAETGLNINNTKVIENKIKIETLEYSLINTYLNGSYIPGTQPNEYDIRQGGLGWGASISGGYRMQFGKIIFDPGVSFYLQKINLENYQIFKPAVVIYARISLSEMIFAEDPVSTE